MIRLHKGNFEGARQILTPGSGSDFSHVRSRVALLAAEFIGDVSLEQLNAIEAASQYDRAWDEALALVPKGDIVAELRRRRAECSYLLGRHQEAYAEAKTGLEHCRELGDRYEEAATYRVLALSAAALGKADEARQWFDQGFAYYDDIETPYEWGKLWMAYGDWLRGPYAAHHADLQGAFEAYHAAREHFERMGAEAKLAEVLVRIEDLRRHQADLALPPETTPAISPATRDLRKPPRRPRGSAELDRRTAWALDSFGVLTRNKVLLDLLSDVAKLAAGRWPILILGESGTGKELIASGIHRLSGRTGTFMPVNCASLPREIIESELFGHVAGAFTGATRDKVGILEVCDGGTVLLDEIAEMSLELQSRLLRFLELGELRRVGATRNAAVDTRIVAATNRDRGALEAGDGFRLDLYYRLAHAVVELPPLRRRAEDIDLLVSRFVDDACTQSDKRVRLSDAARNRLVAFSWPGNVRQLRSYINRLVLLTPPDGEIPGSAVGLDDSGTATSLAEELEHAERRRIVEALAQASGVRTEAAKTLGMSRTTMIGKMKRYGIR